MIYVSVTVAAPGIPQIEDFRAGMSGC